MSAKSERKPLKNEHVIDFSIHLWNICMRIAVSSTC